MIYHKRKSEKKEKYKREIEYCYFMYDYGLCVFMCITWDYGKFSLVPWFLINFFS